MNTPAHLAASLFIWRKEPGWDRAAAVTTGALIPDLPMFWFYGYQKLVGSTEQQIWTTLYFQENWQFFFDIFNSIPLAVFGWAVFNWIWRNRAGQLVALSALVHLLCDLPLHHDDAHRHFLPWTDWRFMSPVSYWDPNHYGRPLLVAELMVALAMSGYVAFRGPEMPLRTIARFNLGLYVFVILLAAMAFARFVIQ